MNFLWDGNSEKVGATTSKVGRDFSFVFDGKAQHVFKVEHQWMIYDILNLFSMMQWQFCVPSTRSGKLTFPFFNIMASGCARIPHSVSRRLTILTKFVNGPTSRHFVTRTLEMVRNSEDLIVSERHSELFTSVVSSRL